MYQSKPILASLFHPYLCMEHLTFRASRIHHNITGAYRVMNGSQQRRVDLILGNGSRFAWKPQSSL